MQATARVVHDPKEMSPTFDPTSAFDDDQAGTVLRRASPNDVPAIVALFGRAFPARPRPARDELERRVRHGWFLIAAAPTGGVVGAVHVEPQGRVARISMLAMDPERRGHALATRLLGVADALCAVFGCTPYEEAGHRAVA
jgi:N-acetylglutamate synthase-like GNAT family acetyltransferase